MPSIDGSGANGLNIEGCALILFTRIPVPGRVKTRLAPILSEQESAQLQEALALDLAEKLSALGNPIVLSYSDEWVDAADGQALRDDFLDKLGQAVGDRCPLVSVAQEGDSLGERMAHAMQAAFDQGASSCLLMGSDLPDIMRHDIQVAQRALGYSDIVLGPSADGGFWLVGARMPFPELFEGKRYSSPTVLTEAVATCRAHGKTVSLSRDAFDIDVPEDYFQLCSQVTKGDFRLGPRTVEAVGHLMAVSAVPSVLDSDDGHRYGV